MSGYRIAPAWMRQAACQHHDPELFFPETNSTHWVRTALRICRGCPVASECLTFALNKGHDEGIWGGYTAEGRRRLHQRQRRGGGR